MIIQPIAIGKINIYGVVSKGRCQVIDYVEELPESDQKQVISLFKLITESGLPRSQQKFRLLGNGIFELKTRGGVRFFCFQAGALLPNTLIITHGMMKPQSRVLKREAKKARKLLDQFSHGEVKILD